MEANTGGTPRIRGHVELRVDHPNEGVAGTLETCCYGSLRHHEGASGYPHINMCRIIMGLIFHARYVMSGIGLDRLGGVEAETFVPHEAQDSVYVCHALPSAFDEGWQGTVINDLLNSTVWTGADIWTVPGGHVRSCFQVKVLTDENLACRPGET